MIYNVVYFKKRRETNGCLLDIYINCWAKYIPSRKRHFDFQICSEERRRLRCEYYALSTIGGNSPYALIMKSFHVSQFHNGGLSVQKNK